MYLWIKEKRNLIPTSSLRHVFSSLLRWLSAPEPNWTEPNKTFYIVVQNNVFQLPRINNVTFRIPSRPFLLHSDDPKERIEKCNLENDDQDGTRDTQECGDGYCDCSHVLNVKLGEVRRIYSHSQNNYIALALVYLREEWSPPPVDFFPAESANLKSPFCKKLNAWSWILLDSSFYFFLR